MSIDPGGSVMEEGMTCPSDLFEAAFEKSPVPMLVLDRSLSIVRTNEATRRASGAGGADLTGLGPGASFQCIHATDGGAGCGAGSECSECPVRRIVTDTLATGREYRREDCTVTLGDEEEPRTVWLSVSAAAVEHGAGFAVVTLEDVTAQRTWEQALQASQERLQALSDAPFEAIFLSENGICLDQNLTAEKLFGYTTEEAIGRPGTDWIAPPDRDLVKHHMLAGSEEPYEARAQRKDGSVFPAEIRARMFEHKGRQVRVTALRDVTARRKAEEQLRRSEGKFRIMFEGSAQGILVLDLHARTFKYANAAICAMLGYTEEEFRGMGVRDIHPPDAVPGVIARFEESANAWAKLNTDVPCRCKDGRIIHVDISGSSATIDGSPCTVAFFSDVTEIGRLRNLESRAQRLETAGRIAGQVAHDFNNLLGPLMAYPDLIRDELPRDHPILGYVASIENSAEKMADISQQLLTLGRRGHYSQEPLNLNETILQTIKEMGPLPESLTCVTELAEDLMNVLGGDTQIYRMIFNLLQNSRDAMQDVGRITIKTENHYVDKASVAYDHVPRGEYVKLTIADNGGGIPDELVQKVFDPFFTSKTKDRQRGTGLGLSVVDAVVKDHRGYLDLTTQIGKGTTFYIYLPITRESVNEGSAETTPGGTESILVIDDDDVQLEVSRKILERLGYRVSVVQSGEAAVDFLAQNPQDLLLLDMVMPPGIDGTETYRRALEVRPGQRAIIVSGFSETDRVVEAQRLGAGSFVRKPLSRLTIATAVRAELDR